MEDLAGLFGSQEKNNDLFVNLVKLLDRQTDHKMNPNLLLGFMGMFNLMSIMSLVRGNTETGFKEIAGQTENSEIKATEQSMVNSLASLLNSASGTGNSAGIGQPDLMGLLGNVASKKKINPGLLLSLFSMLNSQNTNSQQNNSPGTDNVSAVQEKLNPAAEAETEKKSPDTKREVELKYDRKR